MKIYLNHARVTRAASLFVLLIASMNVLAGESGIIETVELWHGPYFGISAKGGSGIGHGHIEYNNSQTTISTNATNVEVSHSSITTTVQGSTKASTTLGNADLFIGYNIHPFESPYIWGVQMEVDFLGVGSDAIFASNHLMKNQTTAHFLPIPVESTSNLSTFAENSINRDSLDFTVSFLARAGKLIRPTSLIYGLVGPTYTTISSAPSTPGDINIDNTHSFSIRRSVLGVSAGAGLEQRLSENWSIRAEYRYMHFNLSATSYASSINTPPTNGTTTSFSASFSVHDHLNYNLGNIAILYRF